MRISVLFLLLFLLTMSAETLAAADGEPTTHDQTAANTGLIACSDGEIIVSAGTFTKSAAISVRSGDHFLYVHFIQPPMDSFFFFPANGASEQMSHKDWAAKLKTVAPNVFDEIHGGRSNDCE